MFNPVLKFREGLPASFARFPALLLCALTWSGAAIWAVQKNVDSASLHFCQRLGLVAALGVPLSFALRVLAERALPNLKRLLEWAALPLVAGYFFVLPPDGFDAPREFILRWALLLGALHFAAAVSGFVTAGEEGFWQFNRRIFGGFCVAALYSGVLTAGLELALLSADKLFALSLDRAYANLFFFMSGFVHPVFFLKGVPRDLDALASDGEYPAGFKAFTQFALAPLAAVFTALLYVYGAKIVLSRAWPHGWVSLPVLLLSGVGILAFLLLHPLRIRADQKWAYWFCRIFPKALAPLSVLLLLAVWERIKAYGVTEERYLGMVAGGCILTWSLVTALRKDAGLRWWPSVLAVVCLACAFGPWSAGTVSSDSQKRRITRFLERWSLLSNGVVTVPEKPMRLEQREFDDFRLTIRYLADHHGRAALEALFPGEILAPDGGASPNAGWELERLVLKKLRFSNVGAWSGQFVRLRCDPSLPVPLAGYRSVSPVVDLSQPRNVGGVWIALKGGGLKVSLQKDGDFEPVPLGPLLSGLVREDYDKSHAYDKTLAPRSLSADWKYKGRRFTILFSHLDFSMPTEGDAQISSCSLLLFEKEGSAEGEEN